MGIVTATAYPSRYAQELDVWEAEALEQENQQRWLERSVGRFFLDLAITKNGKRWTNLTFEQREVAWRIGEMLGAKPIFDRKARNYCVGMWHITGTNLTTDLFDIQEVESVLNVLEVLRTADYAPDGVISIHFRPEQYDMHLILNLCNIVEARNKLIVQALGLTEEIRVIVDEEMAFGVSLSAFSLDVLEACIYLLRQASLQATAVGKARMKPCDQQNPKFQMRSWLLRLGFIGEEFARPRHTLLRNLEGDCAFFDGRGKETAAMHRKAKRMVG